MANYYGMQFIPDLARVSLRASADVMMGYVYRAVLVAVLVGQ